MYISYFGFRESPFSVTPDPRFFYINALYKEALAILHYGIEAKKGFIVITGEVGTGKTTLLRKFMHCMEGSVHSVFIFNTHLSFDELLQLILRDLGLTTQEKDRLTMVEELNGHLIEQLKRGHIVSLLIDEAQNLSDEALEGLRLLSNLETDKEKLLQIVLIGQPELKARLDQPCLRQLKQRVALQCQLAPLDASEVGAYIDFRLKEAGYQGEELFDPDAVDQIILYSRGIPRLINIICDNALLIAFGTSQRKVTMEMIHEAANDLGLHRQPEVDVPAMEVPAAEAEQLSFETFKRRRLQSHRLSRRAQVRIGSVVALLLLVAGTSFSQHTVPDLKNFLGSLLEHPKDGAKFEVSSARYPQPTDAPDTAKEDLPVNQEPGRVTINAAPDNPRPQRTKPNLTTSKAEQPGLEHRQMERKEKAASLGTFQVIRASLVRDKPQSDAEMIATLLPGMHVKVVSAVGSYLQVRSIDPGRIRGYVHREDAFFERSENTQQRTQQYSSLNR